MLHSIKDIATDGRNGTASPLSIPALGLLMLFLRVYWDTSEPNLVLPT